MPCPSCVFCTCICATSNHSGVGPCIVQIVLLRHLPFESGHGVVVPCAMPHLHTSERGMYSPRPSSKQRTCIVSASSGIWRPCLPTGSCIPSPQRAIMVGHWETPFFSFRRCFLTLLFQFLNYLWHAGQKYDFMSLPDLSRPRTSSLISLSGGKQTQPNNSTMPLRSL